VPPLAAFVRCQTSLEFACFPPNILGGTVEMVANLPAAQGSSGKTAQSKMDEGAEPKQMWQAQHANGDTVVRVWGTLEDFEYALPNVWWFENRGKQHIIAYSDWRRELRIGVTQ